jgi:hypothetical protein
MGKYTDQYTAIHKTERYGFSSENKARQIKRLIPADAATVLDYGCGQSRLLSMIDVMYPVWYDPSVDGRDVKPTGKVDLVICTDVLEHIPEDELGEFLTDVFSYSNRVIFTISIRPAYKVLPNGVNAHCTVKSEQWWMELLSKYSEILVPVPALNILNDTFGVKTF